MDKNAASPIEQSIKRTKLEGFVDKNSGRVENDFMRSHQSQSLHPITALSLITLFGLCSNSGEAKDFNPDNPLNPPAPVYWCPSKMPDQQISTKKSSGCQPLYDKEAENSFQQKARAQGFDLPEREPIKIVELQNAASQFADRYRNFLSCCTLDEDATATITDLIDEANHILKAVQQKGIFNSSGFGIGSGGDGLGGGPGQSPKLGTFARQWTLSEIVGTVARARNDLSALSTKLEKLNEDRQALEKADYEASGRERSRIEEEENAIRREFTPKKPAASAPTGMEIQDTTLPSRIGGDIEDTKLNPNFGADIGYSVSPYSNVGESLRPRRGDDVQDSNIPHRPGTDLQDTTIPNSTGFEIDKTQNPDGSSTIQRRGVGPTIGDSDLNRKRR